MKSRTISPRDVERFNNRFKNLTTIILDFCGERGIGYEVSISRAGNVKDKTKLRPYKHTSLPKYDTLNKNTPSNIVDHQGAVVNFLDEQYFERASGVPGLNVLMNNSSIFLGVSPEIVKLGDVVIEPQNITYYTNTTNNSETFLKLRNELIQFRREYSITYAQHSKYISGEIQAEPDIVNASTAQLENYEQRIKQLEYTLRPYNNALATLSKNHMKKMFQTINTRTKKGVTCIIIGELKRNENLLFLNVTKDVKTDYNFDDNNGSLLYYYLSAESLENTFDTHLYYINAKESELNFNDKSIYTLYRIYLDTVGHIENHVKEPLPILLISTDGQRRAPLIALSFCLLEQFDDIFTSPKREDVRKKLCGIFELLRRSHSQDLLGNVSDVIQAFYLAFALKAVQLEAQCFENLAAFCTTYNTYPSMQPLIKALDTIIKDLQSEPNARIREEKMRIFRLQYDTVLRQKFGWSRVNFWSEPEQLDLVRALHRALLYKIDVFDQAIPICNGAIPDYRSASSIIGQQSL